MRASLFHQASGHPGGRCRTLLAIVFAFAGLVSLRAQDEDGPAHFEYVLDEQTELALDSKPKDPKTWSFELRQYGAPEKGVALTLSGEIKRTTGNTNTDTYEWMGEGGARTAKALKVTGDIGGKTSLEVVTKNLIYEDNKPARIHGTFKRIDAAERTKRLKGRWQKADALLTELVNKTAAEVGKSGEEKLRAAHEERLKLRATRAENDVGGPEGDKETPPYYLSLLASTIEEIAFIQIYSGRTVQKGITGSFRTVSGSSLDLSLTADNQLTFTLTLPNPTDGKTGQMTGTARLYGTRAIYREQIKKKDLTEGQEAAEVSFSLRSGHIVQVEAKNTESFTGPGLSYEGDYFKTAPKK